MSRDKSEKELNFIAVKGIDVSCWQTSVNWPAVKAVGIDFAIVRVGYSRNDGSLQIDRQFKNHMEGASAAGLDLGVYCYSYAANVAASRRAAKLTLQAIEPYQLTYPVALDMEYDAIYTKAPAANNTAIAAAFLDEIEKGGYYAQLYCSKDFLDRHLIPQKLTAYDKWIAQYASRCSCPHAFGMWQYSGSGHVSGVKGEVDLDLAYKDYPAIIRRAGLNKLKKPCK